MGQARRRGDFETRKQQSIAAAKLKALVDEARRIEADIAYRKWYNSLTDEQQATARKAEDERSRSRKRAASAVGLALALGRGYL